MATHPVKGSSPSHLPTTISMSLGAFVMPLQATLTMTNSTLVHGVAPLSDIPLDKREYCLLDLKSLQVFSSNNIFYEHQFPFFQNTTSCIDKVVIPLPTYVDYAFKSCLPKD